MRCLSRLRVEAVVSRIALVAILLITLGAPGNTQPCNPAIDGTYCATQPYSKPGIKTLPPGSTTLRSGYAPPIQNLGGDLSPESDQPATLGAISFSGDGSRCIGLLRRGSCN